MTCKAIVGGTLIDGTGAPPRPDAVVVVEDGKIASAGPRDRLDIPQNAEAIDASGNAVIPGLIDAHMHVGFHFQALKRLRDCLDRHSRLHERATFDRLR